MSMHPHGVWYEKDSEGSPYADGAPGEGEWVGFGWAEGGRGSTVCVCGRLPTLAKAPKTT